MAIDGVPGMYAAIGYGIVQLYLDYEEEETYGECGTVPAKRECPNNIQNMRGVRAGKSLAKEQSCRSQS